MPFCVFSRMAAAAILIFQKVTFWTPDDTCIDRTYKHTKVDKELAEIHSFVYFSRWRPPPSWISEKNYFWRWWHLNCTYLSARQIWCKLVINWPRYALLCIFQDGGRRHLEFSKSDISDLWWHLYCPYLQAHQIWCKSIKNWPRYAILYIFQDGGRRHLEFPKSVIFNKRWHLNVTHIHHRIRFGEIDQELAEICPFVYFPRWQPPPSWIFKKWYFGSLMTLVLPVSIGTPNLVQIDQELAEIHPFVYFPRWRPPSSWICYSSILDHQRCRSCWALCYLPMA